MCTLQHEMQSALPADLAVAHSLQGLHAAVVSDQCRWCMVRALTRSPSSSIMSCPAGLIKWSADGRWLAAWSEALPRVVWVWDMQSLRADSVIVHTCSAVALEWHPSLPQLAIATNTPSMYLWAPQVSKHSLGTMYRCLAKIWVYDRHRRSPGFGLCTML